MSECAMEVLDTADRYDVRGLGGVMGDSVCFPHARGGCVCVPSHHVCHVKLDADGCLYIHTHMGAWRRCKGDPGFIAAVGYIVEEKKKEREGRE